MTVVLRAFAIGTVAVGLAAYVLAAGAAVASASAGLAFRAAVGPVLLVAVEHEGATSVSTLGAGLTLVALAGGLVNAVAALLLGRATRGEGSIT